MNSHLTLYLIFQAFEEKLTRTQDMVYIIEETHYWW